jgi:hypothetical protein
MWIVQLALRRPYTFVVALALLLLGVVTISRMPTDIFPVIDIPVVSVIWSFTRFDVPVRSIALRACGRRWRDDGGRHRRLSHGTDDSAVSGESAEHPHCSDLDPAVDSALRRGAARGQPRPA